MSKQIRTTDELLKNFVCAAAMAAILLAAAIVMLVI
jgi:hypothetical protein